jgi:Fic family protein
MDMKRFRPNAPGEIVKIGGEESAFVPAILPPEWGFPLRLWPLLAETKLQVGILEGLGRTLPNPAILLRPLEDREAIQSSRLEGTYASPKELLLFEMEPKKPASDDDPANDWREVINYRRALHQGIQSSLPFSLRFIRDLHRTLLKGVRGRDRTPGEFRRGQVAIGVTRRFVPPPPQRLMECLGPLEKYFHVDEPKYDALVKCFLIHYQFETIHPFNDGNGRVGRLLLSLMLHRCCHLSKPWLHLSEYFEQNREEYINALFNVSAESAWEAWVEFCLQGTLIQTKETIHRCQRLLEIQERFRKKLSSMKGSTRLLQITEGIFHSPYVRVADLARQLDITYPTAKADLERLVEVRILRELENVSPRTFYAPEVFDVAYEKLG